VDTENPRRGRTNIPISPVGRCTFYNYLRNQMKHNAPPDTCPFCEKYHVYRNGRCYECEQSAREARGDEQRERETIERLRDRSFCKN